MTYNSRRMEYLPNAIAVGALIISFLAYRKAAQAFNYTRATTSALNTPVLTFEVKATRLNDIRGMLLIEVKIHNGGQYPTDIVEGYIALKSHNYPEAEKPYKLKGLKVLAGSPRPIKLEFKCAVVYRPRPEIPATELVCEAVYTRLGQENGKARESYVFEEQQHNFAPKV